MTDEKVNLVVYPKHRNRQSVDVDKRISVDKGKLLELDNYLHENLGRKYKIKANLSSGEIYVETENKKNKVPDAYLLRRLSKLSDKAKEVTVERTCADFVNCIKVDGECKTNYQLVIDTGV